MMKQGILVLIILIVAGAVAFANGQPEAYGYPDGTGQGYRGNVAGAGDETQVVWRQGRGRFATDDAAARGGAFGGAADVRFTDDIAAIIAEAEGGPLSADEEDGLLWMYEEEKLARDVYTELYETWNHPVFSSIAQSEQQHMDSVELLLEKYGLDNPSVGREAGEFADPALQSIYDDLIAQGQASLADAFTVGGTIEDLDISDLQKEVAVSDNDDIRIVYQNLMKGSRNHLRSFLRQLDRVGEPYEAQYIEDSYLEQVLAISREVAPITDPEYQL